MTTGRIYRIAVLLSGLSAVLGLGRELVLLQLLGLGRRADGLQYALSVTYTISLLGEAVRLASLNRLQSGIRRAGGSPMVGGMLLSALAVSLIYGLTAPATLPRWLLAAAGLAGLANLVFSAVLPHFQFRAPFLAVHTVTVIPNILIFLGLGGLVVSGTGGSPTLVTGVVLLFLASPLVQLGALGVLSRRLDRVAGVPAGSVVAEGGRIGLHALGAVGGQGAQYLVRTAMLQAAPGALTAFSLCLRAIETARAILVDTYIATRIRTWAGGEAAPPALPLAGLLRGLPLAVLVLVGAAVATAVAGSAGPLLVPIAGLLLLGSYPAVAVRIRYALSNTAFTSTALIAWYAAIEVTAAILTGLVALVPGLPPLGPVWLVYLLKPAAILVMLDRVAAPMLASPGGA